MNTLNYILEDAHLIYDFRNLDIIYPRDTFDEKGYFDYPPLVRSEEKHRDIEDSLESFMSKVIDEKKVKYELNNYKATNLLIKAIKDKRIATS